MSECLQLLYGPTPCFRESKAEITDKLPCSLDFCPVDLYLKENPNEIPWKALHSQCVITDPFDYKGKYRSIQISLIAKLR